jgi:hypothetical protein
VLSVLLKLSRDPLCMALWARFRPGSLGRRRGEVIHSRVSGYLTSLARTLSPSLANVKAIAIVTRPGEREFGQLTGRKSTWSGRLRRSLGKR